MNERKALSGAEWGGIGLFVAGAFGTVLMVASMLWPGALAAGGGTASIAAALGAALGALPTLFLSVCVGWLGARLFLRGPRAGVVRDVLGATGVAFGVSIVLSAVSSELGGRIGSRIGNLAEGALGTVLHVATGLAVIFVTLRIAWGGARAPSTTFAGVPQPETAPRAPTTTPISAENTPRASTPLRTSGSPGSELHSPYPDDVRRRGEIPAGTQPLESPDDRRAPPIEGEPVKELARAAAPAVVSLERARANLAAAPAAAPAELARPDDDDDAEVEELSAARVVEDDDVEATVAEAGEPLVPAASWEQPDLFEEEPVDAYGTPITLVEDVRRERADEGAAPRPAGIVPAEIGAVVDEDDDVGEPVPLVASTVAKVEAAARHAEPAVEDEDLDELEALVAEDELDAADEDADLEEQTDDELEDELDEVFAQDEADALADGEDDALLDEEAEAEAPRVAIVAAAWESVEVSDEIAPEVELAEAAAPGAVRADVDAEAESSRESEDASQAAASLETTRSSLVEAMRKARAGAASTDAAEGEAWLAEATAEPIEAPSEAEARIEAPARSTSAAELDSDVGVAERLAAIGARAGEHDASAEVPDAGGSATVDALAAAAATASAGDALPNGKASRKRGSAKERDKEKEPKDEPRARPASTPTLFDGVEPAVDATATEGEVVLTPVAPVPPERAVKTAASLDGRKKLLADAGCLFLERGRVAVSMLQRDPYGLDFDDACKVLDEMQEMGLIGPYLGGQRRDFLMSREQWLERLATA